LFIALESFFNVNFHKWNYSYEFWKRLISLELHGLLIFKRKLQNDKDLKIYEYIYHKQYTIYKIWKVKNKSQKWHYMWYFCMKVWLVNDIDTNSVDIGKFLKFIYRMSFIRHVSFVHKPLRHYDIIFLIKITLKWKNNIYMKGPLFFIFI
jgi:hypothetical protein